MLRTLGRRIARRPVMALGVVLMAVAPVTEVLPPYFQAQHTQDGARIVDWTEGALHGNDALRWHAGNQPTRQEN